MSDLISRWRQGLSRTSKSAFGRLAGLLGATQLTAETWDELEAVLLQADLGMESTRSIVENLKGAVRDGGLTKADELQAILRTELRSRLAPPPDLRFGQGTCVILLVGVNGSGKTTTAAKLTQRFMTEGRRVLLGAADTFRAAAVEQLQTWAGRLGAEVVSGQPGSDSAAVAFNAVQGGVARAADVVIIDTAGRLHTRSNLMEELKKVHRVVGKALPGAPHHVWLVLDSTTGQNALQQARQFKEAVDVSGVILAKLDSSARGGMAFAIQHELGLPILFVGLGERPEDLVPFDPEAFVDGILAVS